MLDSTTPHEMEELWEQDLLERYPENGEKTAKKKEEFRNYDDPARDTVREFYRLNHTYQTYDFVLEKEKQYLSFNKKEMPVWEAFDFLNQLVDDSDPDIELDQLQRRMGGNAEYFRSVSEYRQNIVGGALPATLVPPPDITNKLRSEARRATERTRDPVPAVAREQAPAAKKGTRR